MIKPAQFIIVDVGDSIPKKKNLSLAVEGSLCFNIGGVYPIIEKGRKCLCLAKIISYTVKEHVTVITFDYVNCETSVSKAMFYLYTLNSASSTSTNDDLFGDSFIPGVRGSSFNQNSNSGFTYHDSQTSKNKTRGIFEDLD
jgi:hypothetical protein